MAITRDTLNDQAGGGSRGESAPPRPESERGREAADADPAAATGHTTPGAGSAVDLGDILTATDGASAGDPAPDAL